MGNVIPICPDQANVADGPDFLNFLGNPVMARGFDGIRFLGIRDEEAVVCPKGIGGAGRGALPVALDVVREKINGLLGRARALQSQPNQVPAGQTGIWTRDFILQGRTTHDDSPFVYSRGVPPPGVRAAGENRKGFPGLG